jgi:hypothetical protein
MPVDVIPSIPASQTLRYAKASYDFDRDGGEVGFHSIPSQQVPAGATVLDPTIAVQTPPTADDVAIIAIMLGSLELVANPYTDFGAPTGGPGSALAIAPADGSLPITLEIRDFPLTAGALVLYVWYVL